MTARPRSIVEGVNPRAVFKIKASTRIKVRPGLTLLADTQDWVYFVVPKDVGGARLSTELEAYEKGTAIAAVEKFFDNVVEIEPYGPEDPRGPGIPDQPAEDLLVDVDLWSSPDGPEAQKRLLVDEMDDPTASRVLDRMKGFGD